MTPIEFNDFKKYVKKIDKEKGNATAIGVVRGAIYFNKLTTKEQFELIQMILQG